MLLDIITYFCTNRMIRTEKGLERLDLIIWDSRVGDILPCCSAIVADIWLETV